jgi:hypothetical protein
MGSKEDCNAKEKGVVYDAFGFYSVPALSIRKYCLRVCRSDAMATQQSSLVSTAVVTRRSCLSQRFITIAR